jgi:repressor LexA
MNKSKRLENLIELRKEKGMTQLQMAKELNIAQNTYSQYETGQRQIDDEMKIKIATFFNVTIGHILGEEQRRSRLNIQLFANDNTFDDQKKLIEEALGEDAFALYKKLKNATPEQLKYIKAILDADDEKESE